MQETIVSLIILGISIILAFILSFRSRYRENPEEVKELEPEEEPEEETEESGLSALPKIVMVLVIMALMGGAMAASLSMFQEEILQTLNMTSTISMTELTGLSMGTLGIMALTILVIITTVQFKRRFDE